MDSLPKWLIEYLHILNNTGKEGEFQRSIFVAYAVALQELGRDITCASIEDAIKSSTEVYKSYNDIIDRDPGVANVLNQIKGIDQADLEELLMPAMKGLVIAEKTQHAIDSNS